MTDQDGKPVSSLLFKGCSEGVDIYITQQGLSYVFNKTEKQIIAQAGNQQGLPGHTLKTTELEDRELLKQIHPMG